LIDQTKQREHNYNMLVDHLKNTNQSINKELFKTILYAIHSITIYKKTIPAAFKLSIDKYSLDYEQFATLKSILYKLLYSNGEYREIHNQE
jgi:hypothetical protein